MPVIVIFCVYKTLSFYINSKFSEPGDVAGPKWWYSNWFFIVLPYLVLFHDMSESKLKSLEHLMLMNGEHHERGNAQGHQSAHSHNPVEQHRVEPLSETRHQEPH